MLRRRAEIRRPASDPTLADERDVQEFGSAPLCLLAPPVVAGGGLDVRGTSQRLHGGHVRSALEPIAHGYSPQFKAIMDALEAVAEQHRALDRDLLDNGRAAALADLATMLARHERAPILRRSSDLVPQSLLQQIAVSVSRGEPGAVELASAIRSLALP